MKLSEYLMRFIGAPYVWAGDGSGKCGGGYDCSGLVLEGLWALGWIDKPDRKAKDIYAHLEKTWIHVPRGLESQDDILFFGKDLKNITHTAVAIGDGLMIEAYGTSKCTSADKSTGKVHVRPIRDNIVAALRRP